MSAVDPTSTAVHGLPSKYRCVLALPALTASRRDVQSVSVISAGGRVRGFIVHLSPGDSISSARRVVSLTERRLSDY